MSTNRPHAMLPRLLLASSRGSWQLGMADHLDAHGPLPYFGRAQRSNHLVEIVDRAGLLGRGGANFPAARKLAAVATAKGRKVAVANGCEGEPASAKDKALMTRAPHLVLDGLALAAEAVGADEVILATSPDMAASFEPVLAERAARSLDRHPPCVVQVPERFLSGESSALVNFLNGGPGLPTLVPPRPDQKGVRGRPTLVQNVETLAHIALIARHGPEWFRAVGTDDDPGSALLTVRGAVRLPGVYEVARGTRLGDVVEMAGGATRPVQAFLLGGYGGTWVPATRAWDAPLSERSLAERGATLGNGFVFVFPEEACGLMETARILSYLAREGAGQCGPCVNGLPAMAGAAGTLARGVGRRDVVERLEAWAWQVKGRGACHHPDGAVRLLSTALGTFAEDVALHRDHSTCRGAAAALHRRPPTPTMGRDDPRPVPGRRAAVTQLA